MHFSMAILKNKCFMSQPPRPYKQGLLNSAMLFSIGVSITDNNSFYVFSFISYLNSLFAIRDLGHLNYFLGVEVLHGGTTLHLNQNKSIQDLLTPNNTLDSKPKHTSSMLGKTLSQNDGEQLMDARVWVERMDLNWGLAPAVPERLAEESKRREGEELGTLRRMVV
ncbi:hypothetical protein CK203_099014 [Vitis vinifera]|uniref:Reverse transcriptase Ty1/copia-type domain-containing protein n=1 Tax=Vitis vinifera TaxID=29760 RepID=A0A438D8T7_VITVI|nr:hypothetical protein CK203_099014 [Vitis vinifera]